MTGRASADGFERLQDMKDIAVTSTSNRSQLDQDARDRARAALALHQAMYGGGPGAAESRTTSGESK